MPTMQEYLEEMARRQALGWTPGVPSRFTAPVATSWNLPITARTTMRQAVPKANLGDIAATSADPVRKQGVGRPRLTPEEIQRTASRQGMGTIGKTVRAIAPFAKVAGPVGLVAELLRSEPAVASTEVPPGGYFYESQAYPSMAVEEGYPNVSTLPSFDVTPDAGGAIGGVPGTSAEVPSLDVVTDVAPSMQGVDYSQALAGIGVDPATSGMAEVVMASQDSGMAGGGAGDIISSGMGGHPGAGVGYDLGVISGEVIDTMPIIDMSDYESNMSNFYKEPVDPNVLREYPPSEMWDDLKLSLIHI